MRYVGRDFPILDPAETADLLFDFTLPTAYTGAGLEITSGKWIIKAVLANMKPGERTFFESPRGKLSAFQSTLALDIKRAGYQGFISTSLVLGVEVNSRESIDLVMCVRRALPEEKDESVRSVTTD